MEEYDIVEEGEGEEEEEEEVDINTTNRTIKLGTVPVL